MSKVFQWLLQNGSPSHSLYITPRCVIQTIPECLYKLETLIVSLYQTALVFKSSVHRKFTVLNPIRTPPRARYHNYKLKHINLMFISPPTILNKDCSSEVLLEVLLNDTCGPRNVYQTEM